MKIEHPTLLSNDYYLVMFLDNDYAVLYFQIIIKNEHVKGK